MKKKLDTSIIENELRMGSVFFQREKPSVPVPILSTPEKQEEDEGAVFEETKKHISSETSFRGNKETNQQADKETKKQRNMLTKRFSTYLTEDSIKAMKRLAFETERKDYELFQEAIDKYLEEQNHTKE